MSVTELVRDLVPLTLRTVLLFVFVLAVMRWTGKRTVGSLAPFDLAVVIMMGEVAAIPIADLQVDLLHGLWPVALLGLLHIGLAGANLRWRRLERFTEGTATLLVQDSRPLLDNMRRERVSMHDLEAAMRFKSVHSLEDVQEVWMEHSGGISVVLKEEARPLTRGHLAEQRQPSVAPAAGVPVPGNAVPAVVVRRVERALMDRLGLGAEPPRIGKSSPAGLQ